MRAHFVALAVVLSACAKPSAPPPPAPAPQPPAVTADYVRSTLSALADDSMQGRRTATPGAARAARFIASQFAASHLAPLGDSAYFQKVPLILNAKGELDVPASAADTAGHHSVIDVNVIAVLRGSDPVLKNQVVLVDAHFDHLGAGKPVNGDSIFNGADDDASGVVTVLAVARALAAGPPPKRTILFVATTGEELGLFGTRWLIGHFPVPLDSLRANLEIEMIGRPDPHLGPGKAWLTGYERTTMADIFKTAGLAVFPDPYPDQHFFERSDNIAYAEMGVPAQTLSSYGLHTDYHAVTDDMARVDVEHMTTVIATAIAAVRMLADGPRIEWLQGGRPKE